MSRVRARAGAVARKYFPGIHGKYLRYLGEGRFAGQKPEEVFSTIYRERLWGEHADGSASSGVGNADAAAVEPYVEAVRHFLSQQAQPVTLVDLGCGDFRVGRRLAPAVARYIGCDVVPELIERHTAEHAGPGVEFKRLDLVEDAFPNGDVATIKQVLQHLSNAQIGAIVPKLQAYDHVIVAEHVPAGDFPPNLDKAIGASIRLRRGSGVVIGEPPFQMRGFAPTRLCSVPGTPGLIVTTLWSRATRSPRLSEFDCPQATGSGS